jgi:photosystem II stability/assembly factor-like uncharacterized protein
MKSSARYFFIFLSFSFPIIINAQWQKIIIPGTGGAVNALATHAGGLYSGSSTGYLCYSHDNAENWKSINPGTLEHITALAMDYNAIYVATEYRGIYVTKDDGKKWIQFNTGLENQKIYSLALINNILFAGSSSGIFKSYSNDASWIKLASKLIDQSVKSLYVNDSLLYAATSSSILISNDLAKNWKEIKTKFRYIEKIAVSDTLIFVWSYNQGVFLSIDEGKSWTAVNTGLNPKNDMRAFAILEGYLFAGADADIIWRRPISEMIIEAKR